MAPDDHAAPAPPLLDALHDLATMMAGPVTVKGILERVGEWCATVLPVDGVGVLIRDEAGGLLVATASSEIGQQMEELEVELQEGPCSSSFALGEIVRAPDLEGDDRFPRFAPRALEIGIRSVHAVPMIAGGTQLGSLDVVAREAGELADGQLATAQLLADVTTSYIVNSRMLEEATALAEQLRRALENRIVIEQAKGVLSERHGITVQEGFERMRSHARSTRTKLMDVAQQVLSGDLQP